MLSIFPAAALVIAACGGAPQGNPDTVGDVPASGGVPSTDGAARDFRGDDSDMPSFGGWASGTVPVDAIARAGFDWFETGYPGDKQGNEILASAGVRPFAYINGADLEERLWGVSGYTGPILQTRGVEGNMHSVDVTDPSWLDWIARRADEAYRAGSRGIKWDLGNPELPPGKTRADVNEAIASVMRRIREVHPDMKFIFNQAFEFAAAHPELVDGIQTEGLFSAWSFPAAYLKPWEDPWYWGPQFQRLKSLQQLRIPVFVAEYEDPFSARARELYDAITAQGFVPYITSERWDVRGRGYRVQPGW